MTAPSITINLIDPGALGQPVNTAQIPVYVGVASQGDLAVVQEFGSLSDVVTEYDHGHLVDVAELAFAGGAPSVKLCRVTTAVAGDIAGEDDTDASLLIDSVTGTPLNFLAVRIEAVEGTSGPVSGGAVKVRYSLDNWDIPFVDPTWSGTITVPGSGLISLAGTGLTVDLNAAQTPVAGDFNEFTVTAGHYGATEVAAVTDALRLPTAGDYTYVVYTGSPASASAANTIAGAIGTQLSALFSEARFFGALADGGLGTDAQLITAIASTSTDPPFLSLGYGEGYTNKAKAAVGRGRVALREHEVAAIRIRSIAISTDPGRTASGALSGVVGTDYDGRLEGMALHDARVSILRSWEPAARGLFITRQRMLAPSDSNFVSWQFAAVMIVALRVAHQVGFSLILESMRRTAQGTLDPRDAADIKGAIEKALGDVLLDPTNVRGTPGHASAIGATVSLTTPLPALSVNIKVRPLNWPTDLVFNLQYADNVA